MADDAPRQFEIDLPPEVVPGSYADFANVWHTPDVFVMDFVSLARPPQAATDAEGNAVTVVPGRASCSGCASLRGRCSSWRRRSLSSWSSGSRRRAAAPAPDARGAGGTRHPSGVYSPRRRAFSCGAGERRR